MNQIPLYQHPYVDVLKISKATQQREGDVKDQFDSDVAKNCIQIQGPTLASNYLQIPATKLLPKASLGLIGKYVYVQMNVPVGKNYVIHLDYMVNETRLVKISFSNIYKEFKNLNGSSIQIPMPLISNKWTVVAINASSIFETNNIFSATAQKSFFLRSLQVCANVLLKGIYTSDIKYTVQTIPKEIAFKLLKSKDWYFNYNWIDFPEVQQENQDLSNQISQQQISDKQQTKQKKTVKFKPKFTNKPQPNQDLPINVQEEEEEDKNVNEQQEQETINVQEILKGKDGIERTMKEIEKLQIDNNITLQNRILQENADAIIYGDYRPLNPPHSLVKQQEENTHFVLKPNPIMKLSRIVGMNPNFQSQQIFYNNDLKLSHEILYTQANLLLGYQSGNQQKQRLFYDHQTSAIISLLVEANFALTIQRSMSQQGENSKDLELSVWDVDECTCLFTFKPPFVSIHSITVSADLQNLCLAGKDAQKRDTIIIYDFPGIFKFKKVEIRARQLSDHDICHMKFNITDKSSIISCGRENIKFYKIKSGHLPGKAVVLNNTARNKIFNNSIVDYTDGANGSKIANYVFCSTDCGLLYMINYQSKQVDKIIQIHENKITALHISSNRSFCVSASTDGILRIWKPDFSKLISEVQTHTPIAACAINLDEKEVCVLSEQGSIAILDLAQSAYTYVMRSHQDNITDLTYNSLMSKLITIGEDNTIKIWNALSMIEENEFLTQNDRPIIVQSHPASFFFACGFKSGFIRIFDLQTNKMHYEIMIFESPIADISFSSDSKFMAVSHKSSKIVIFNIEKQYQPIKTIEFDFPNENYYSICFSPDSAFLANISSNANIVTVWETKNFSLKYNIDLTGDIIQKIMFAPNCKDFMILTVNSRLKFYRIQQTEMRFYKDSYGVTDLECLDVQVSSNNQFLMCAGKEGHIRVYDYFMRGEMLPSSQAFLGHFKYPKKLIITPDGKSIYSIGQGNGIFVWNFHGDSALPIDIRECYEKLVDPASLKTQTLAQATKALQFTNQYEIDENLQTYADYKIEQQKGKEGGYDNEGNNDDRQELSIRDQTFGQASNSNIGTGTQILKQQTQASSIPKYQHESNPGSYKYEQFELKLKKVLSLSTTDVLDNLVWNKQQRYIAYTNHNIVIVEDLNQEKSQRILKEGNDKIFQLSLSPNQRWLLAFTMFGQFDGFPCIIVWDACTLKKLNLIAVNDSQVFSVEFSPNSNMLLVLSRPDMAVEKTNISVWDFLEGQKEILCHSALPNCGVSGKWSMYIEDEFVTCSKQSYNFWRILNSNALQYQEGHMPPSSQSLDKNTYFTCIEYQTPTSGSHSIYVLIGTSNGFVWVIDSRTNQFIYSCKVVDCEVKKIISVNHKIFIEGNTDQILHCWPMEKGSEHDPMSYFRMKEIQLTLDGYPTATCYDELGNEGMVGSRAGTLWFVSWNEKATIKIKSCHSPLSPMNCFDFKYLPASQFQIEPENKDLSYGFDQNYMIASSGTDGIIKLWNMFDFEYHLQLLVPKEQCLCLAMHQFKPYILAGYSDGYVRFTDINKSKNLGRSIIAYSEDLVDPIISIKILPSGNHILCASRHGLVILIFVQSWDPLAIKLETLANINTSLSSYDISFLEPYNKWLVATSNGKVIVYNRADFNNFQQEIFSEEQPPKFNFMDSFNVLDYESNNFTESKRTNTLNHFYSLASNKRVCVTNDVVAENETNAVFLNNDLTLYVAFIKKCNYLFFRNFELHQCVKRIKLEFIPSTIAITNNSHIVVTLHQSSTIKLIDSVNVENSSQITTIHEEICSMKLCPNGKYVITGGNHGDVCLWEIKKYTINPYDQQEGNDQ